MSDYIDRQAAIDFIDTGHFVNPNEPRWSDNEVVNFLKSRPSADVQPVRHGRWIEDKEVEYVCSECGEQCANTVMGMPRDRYCKWCGARMDGEQDG